MPSKVVPVEAAVARISDRSTVSICGAWINIPDSTLAAVRKQFVASGHPRDLTVVFAICPGGVPSQPSFSAENTPEQEGTLLHGVYHYPKGIGVDESVIWGDHFFVEALYKALANVTVEFV